MKKNTKTLDDRARYVQNTVNRRHKSENVEMCVARIAKTLFLSESTIWKDFTKELKPEK